MTRPLVIEDFEPRLGEPFAPEGLADLPLILTEVKPLRAHWKGSPRPPFSLVFVGKDPRILEQRLYRFDLSGIGKVDIFLVPIGRDENGVSYQAVFN